MFNNIGSKIKGFAKFIFWVGVILSVIIAIGFMVSALGAKSSSSESPALIIIIGVLIVIGGIVFSWLETFLLYGFGELIDSNQKILQLMERKNIDQ